MAIYKRFNEQTDKNVGLTKVITSISGTLPASLPGPEKGVLFPPGYKRKLDGNIYCTSSFFTLSTGSQIVDISYGIRSGCFDDANSMFYQSNTGWRNDSTSAGGFTSNGLNAFETSSMVYASTANLLNDGNSFSLDGDTIDLLGILNFKRSSYKQELNPGSLTLVSQRSGALAAIKTNDTAGTTTTKYTYNITTNDSIVGSSVGNYSNIKSDDGTIVGGMYYDYGIAILDLFKFFFPSSTDRLVTNRSRLMNFITGSSTTEVLHGLAFFSGSEDNIKSKKKIKYFRRTDLSNQRANDLLNFYSGSYSQSLSSLAYELGGVSVQSKVNFQSSIFYCRANKDEFNYSQNPTAGTGSGDNRIAYRMESPTTYVTSVGLYSDSNQLLAVGKLSQPFKKDYATEMNLRVRLDF